MFVNLSVIVAVMSLAH